MFAFVKKLIPKKNSAIVSITHVLIGKFGISRMENEAIIPIPQTRKMIFLILFLSVISPTLFVKRKIEL